MKKITVYRHNGLPSITVTTEGPLSVKPYEDFIAIETDEVSWRIAKDTVSTYLVEKNAMKHDLVFAEREVFEDGFEGVYLFINDSAPLTLLSVEDAQKLRESLEELV